jgi:hypothetical protein
MAGTHAVSFEFCETAVIESGYKLKPKPYKESATEVVVVAENSPTRICLQHLLIVTAKDGGKHIIKHWAQIWTWQDTDLLDYHGSEDDHLWRKIKLTPDQAEGTWSQLVTQIDDTPRYEGYGKWTHNGGASSWQGNPTRRPLPRREYTTRDDYDYLLGTNRLSLSERGWIHRQDNRKVVDREGTKAHALCQEIGVNTYNRIESTDTDLAINWWKDNGTFWDGVRNFWTRAGEQSSSSFTYSTHQNGEGLSKLFERLEKEKPTPESVNRSLQAYVVSK